jgi:hypothetical protein
VGFLALFTRTLVRVIVKSMINEALTHITAEDGSGKPSNPQLSRKGSFLADLLAVVDDPNHKKILGAYKEDDPIASMEGELSRILLEIVES